MRVWGKNPWLLLAGAPLLLAVSIASGDAITFPKDQSDARDLNEKAKQILGRIQKIVKTANDQKDVIKLNCLTGIVATAGANQQVAGAAAAALEAGAPAVRMRSGDYKNKVDIAFQNLLTAETEANACIGQVTSASGDATTTTTIDSNIPTEDPTIRVAGGDPATDGTIRPPETNNCTAS